MVITSTPWSSRYECCWARGTLLAHLISASTWPWDRKTQIRSASLRCWVWVGEHYVVARIPTSPQNFTTVTIRFKVGDWINPLDVHGRLAMHLIEAGILTQLTWFQRPMTILFEVGNKINPLTFACWLAMHLIRRNHEAAHKIFFPTTTHSKDDD